MDANRSRRRPAARLEPGYPQQLAADAVLHHAALWDYVKRVLIDGETPPCDAGTAAILAGMVLGQHVHGLCMDDGLTLEQGIAAGLRWVAEHAALSGSLAATEAAAPEDAVTPLADVRREAAAYVLAVMSGRTPEAPAPWMPRALAGLLHASMSAGFQISTGDGMDVEAARAATRAHLEAMAEEG